LPTLDQPPRKCLSMKREEEVRGEYASRGVFVHNVSSLKGKYSTVFITGGEKKGVYHYQGGRRGQFRWGGKEGKGEAGLWCYKKERN